MDLASMTSEQLVEQNQALGREADAIREQRRAINAELARRDRQREIDALEAVLADLKAGRQPGVAPGAVIEIDVAGQQGAAGTQPSEG